MGQSFLRLRPRYSAVAALLALSTATSAADAQDTEAPYRAFRAYRSSMNQSQLANGIATTSLGLGTVGAGAVLQANDSGWGVPLLIGGGIVVLTSGIAMLAPNPAQSFGREHNVDSARHSLEESSAFELAWQGHAKDMKQRRTIVGWLGIGVGTAMTGSAIALAVLANKSVSSGTQEGFSALFLGLGVWNVGAGVGALIWESPAETSFRVYQEGKQFSPASSSFRLGLLPTVGGAALGASGIF